MQVSLGTSKCCSIRLTASSRHARLHACPALCSGEPSKLPSDGSVRKASKQDMQAKLDKARRYKQNMAPLVRPDTSTTQSSADGSSLETDLLVSNRLHSNVSTSASEAVAPFVMGEQVDTSATLAAGTHAHCQSAF